MSQRTELLKARIAAKKEAQELVQIGLDPIREKLDHINSKVIDYGRTYSYWLDYNHPTLGISNANIRDAHDQWKSMINERTDLLASVGLRMNNHLVIEVIAA